MRKNGRMMLTYIGPGEGQDDKLKSIDCYVSPRHTYQEPGDRMVPKYVDECEDEKDRAADSKHP